jgi:hypothetical protein
MPVYRWTVTGVPMVVRVPHFDKPRVREKERFLGTVAKVSSQTVKDLSYTRLD